MNTLNNNLTTLFFCICLIPFSISIGGSGTSVSYAYALIPFFLIIKYGNIKNPGNDINLIIFLFTALFFLNAFVQVDYWELTPRKIISFALFSSIFALAFFDISREMERSFLLAIVIISLLYSMRSIYMLIQLDLATIGYWAKGEVGGQRFGFIYLMAFWIVFFYQPSKLYISWLKVICLGILFLGICLTFSRSSMIGFVFSSMIYMFFYMRLSEIFRMRYFLWFILLLPIAIYLIYRFNIDLILILIFDFFWDYGFSILTFSEEKSVELLNLSNPESSAGYRLFLIQKIINYSLSNLFGSGFLGIWIILDDLVGSAHGQYNDILFRTGFFGLFIYIYMLSKLWVFLKHHNPGLFVGFNATLIYGLFHETYKLGQGSFILAFILALWATSLRNKETR